MDNRSRDLHRLYMLARLNVFGRQPDDAAKLDEEYRSLKTNCECAYGFETTFRAYYYGEFPPDSEAQAN